MVDQGEAQEGSLRLLQGCPHLGLPDQQMLLIVGTGGPGGVELQDGYRHTADVPRLHPPGPFFLPAPGAAQEPIRKGVELLQALAQKPHRGAVAEDLSESALVPKPGQDGPLRRPDGAPIDVVVAGNEKERLPRVKIHRLGDLPQEFLGPLELFPLALICQISRDEDQIRR